jgi:hypothetical protein
MNFVFKPWIHYSAHAMLCLCQWSSRCLAELSIEAEREQGLGSSASENFPSKWLPPHSVDLTTTLRAGLIISRLMGWN